MNDVERYIHQFPEETQTRLQAIRQLVMEYASDAVEHVAYAMPAYKLAHKPLIYFAGFKHHIGVYALPTTHSYFAEELKEYKQGKGSVQFPLSSPIPLDLIKRMIVHRVQEILEKKQ